MNEHRRTKIVCTIGPASRSPEVLGQLIRAGLDVARLNFSHGSHEDHRETYARIRAAEAEARRPIAVLQDLQGPKIRLGKIDGEVHLEPGHKITISANNDFVGTQERLPSTYPHLATDLRPGETVLLADGRLRVEVIAIEGAEVHCRVVVGGVLTSRKGINLPGTKLSIPALTDKDLEDLKFGLDLGVDYVALSFVRTPHDVTRLQDRMREHGRVVPIISKIEKPEAVEYLEHIIDVSDGIMIARGDLGVELPPEQVPRVQRRGIRMARERGKLTVVATQMLMSMTTHARPTHAEVSDVANAVFDGADAVMLSEETAAGQFPVRAVETMSALAASAEEAPEAFTAPKFVQALRSSHAWAICQAAVVTADEIQADALVSYTHQGLGPRLVANWRPTCLILGCAKTDEEARRMAFYWGVRPMKLAPPSSVEGLLAAVENTGVDEGLLKAGQTIVITSKIPFTDEQITNMLKIHTIERRRR